MQATFGPVVDELGVTPPIADPRREWLPEPDAISNSGRESQLALRGRKGVLYVRNSVGFGTEADSNSNSSGARS